MNENKLPEYHPLIAAWNKYKGREEYAAIRSWAAKEKYVDGSLWDAFMSGWQAFKDVRNEEEEAFKKHLTPHPLAKGEY